MVRRLALYSAVGALSTSIHYAILYFLLSKGVVVWLANGLGFLGGFVASFTFQQKYTFNDRLEGYALNHKAGITIFVINLAANGIIGQLASKALIMLPLFPAAINFSLFYCMTGLRYFRKNNFHD